MTAEKTKTTKTKQNKTVKTAKRHLNLLQEHEQIKLPDEVTNSTAEVLNPKNKLTEEQENKLVTYPYSSDLLSNTVTVTQINMAVEVLRRVNLLTEEELKAYWVSVMFDKTVEPKDRLTASRLLAQSQGMLSNNKAIASSGGAIYRWQTPTDAEVVHEAKTEQEN